MKKFFQIYIKDSHNLFLSVFKYFGDNPDLDREKYLEKHPKRSAVIIDRLFEDLNNESFSEIIKIYRDLKKEYVEKLIDCIAHPNKEEYLMEQNGKKINLKDFFQSEIKRKVEEIAEEDRKIAGRQVVRGDKEQEVGAAHKELEEAFEKGENKN